MRALVAMLLLCLSLAAQAGSNLSAATSSTPSSTSTTHSAFTQTQLAHFAQADKAVQQVRVRYLGVLLKDQQEKRDSKWSQAAMQIDMAKAIKAAGLSLDDYNHIAHAMAEDETLRQRIEKME